MILGARIVSFAVVTECRLCYPVLDAVSNAPAMPKLLFTQPEFAMQSCDLPEGKTTVGRSSHNTLVLSDASVSAHHCELLVSWNEVIVRDHGSSNGTWVAGVRVTGQRPANHSDLIRFGRVEARLELDGFPTDDATSVTANFGSSRADKSPPDPESFRRVIESSSTNADTRIPTVSLPEPAKPTPPAVSATPQPTLPKPAPAVGHPGRRWLKLALRVGVALAAAWLLRMFL